MIDFFNEIFTKISKQVKKIHGQGVKVVGENVSVPKEFPCVTIDEVLNVPYQIDGGEQKYASVTYRVQIFSNKKTGKRAEARNIFSTISDMLYDMNLIAKTYTATPSIYNNEIYEIQATFEAVIDKNGKIYRR